MRFYTKQHKFYCGIVLHTKNMFVCIIDAGGNVRVHQNIHTNPKAFLRIIAPFREDVVVAVWVMGSGFGNSVFSLFPFNHILHNEI